MLRIGVDGGGTTTRAVLIDEELRVLGRAEAGPGNPYSAGVERAVENVMLAIDGALQEARVPNEAVASWGLGLAGVCTPQDQDLMQTRLRPLAPLAVLVVDEDAAAAQAGAFGGAAGAICIAGTGSNCFGINEDGQRARADGLGPLLGDRGSGYWIGEQALRLLCRVHDGCAAPSNLVGACLDFYQIATLDDLVLLVYSPDFTKDRIAALVPAVLEAAASGDEAASVLLRRAGEELAGTTVAVLRKLDLWRVAPCGGVLSRDTPVRAAFEEALRRVHAAVQVQEPQHDAAIGAALLARR